MKDNVEKRVLSADVSQIQLRKADDDGPETITGYAAVFNRMSEDLGGFREVIMPGAFDDAIAAKQDVRALVEHQGGLTTIGRTTNGTLRLRVDNVGLGYEITPPDTQAGRDIKELIRRRDIDQSSFGFTLPRDGSGENIREDDKGIVAEVLKVNRLFDVSPVTFPAYPETSVQVRDLVSAYRQAKTDAEGERALADKERRERRIRVAEATV